MKHIKWQWVVKGIVFGALFISAITFLTMFLWNNLATALFGLPVIGFFQALGLMVLGRLLTGGFRPRGGGFGPGAHMRQRFMGERWKNMSEAERQEFMQRWRSRCGPDFSMEDKAAGSPEETA